MGDPVIARVLVAAEPAPGLARVVTEGFWALGVTARIRWLPARRGPEEMQWLVLATLPVQAVLGGLGTVVAEDLARWLKRLVVRVLRHRRNASPPPVLVLQDADTGLQVVLEAGLPEEAYSALVALDLAAFGPGPLHYDLARRRWRSELDEWRRRHCGTTDPP